MFMTFLIAASCFTLALGLPEPISPSPPLASNGVELTGPPAGTDFATASASIGPQTMSGLDKGCVPSNFGRLSCTNAATMYCNSKSGFGVTTKLTKTSMTVSCIEALTTQAGGPVQRGTYDHGSGKRSSPTNVYFPEYRDSTADCNINPTDLNNFQNGMSSIGCNQAASRGCLANYPAQKDPRYRISSVLGVFIAPLWGPPGGIVACSAIDDASTIPFSNLTSLEPGCVQTTRDMFLGNPACITAMTKACATLRPDLEGHVAGIASGWEGGSPQVTCVSALSYSVPL